MNIMASELTQAAEIRFAVGKNSLGRILVARSERGVCAILLGDDADDLVRDLRARFPHARLIGGDTGFAELVAKVVAFVETPRAGLDLPLDLRGTAFQRRVWQALREIPAGKTASYADVANRLGHAEVGSGGRPGLRGECHRGGDPLPSRRPARRRHFRLPLGRRAQARPAAKGGGGVNIAARTKPVAGAAGTPAERVAAIDWNGVADDLGEQGSAVLEKLLTPDECRAIAALYEDDGRFRSRVVMARHGFGKGEYKYFAYPLPDLVADFRTALYPRLAPIANGWNERMGIEQRYPAGHAAFLQRCHEAGQLRPTPLLLQYGPGDYNCLHQDLYGELVFPLQVAFLLSEPGARLHRRRVRAHGAAAAHAVAARGRAAAAG